MILVFDMDDTLYDELSYVRSGFTAVARMLAPICRRPAAVLRGEMLRIMNRQGRGRIFDDLLAAHGCHSRELVRRCVRVYRSHRPEISLWPEARACLRRHAGLPLYVVTDGSKSVQHRKAVALGLYGIAKRILLTHRFGLRHAKPSPYCFKRIAAWEGVSPREVLYVGDNPAKDFVGIRRLGFRTVRVRTGQYAAVKARAGHNAARTIASLAELELPR